MSNLRPRTCRECGRTFPGGPRAWHCPECRAIRSKTHNAIYRKNGPARPLGSTDNCVKCGKPYTINSARQMYCPACAREAVMEVDRRQSLEWYHENAGEYNPTRNDRRRKDTAECVVCGKVFLCDGTRRNTCSEGCRDRQKKEWQRIADEKRNPRNRSKAEEL